MSYDSNDTGTTITFVPTFQGIPLLLNEDGQEINDSLQIETFKCYISQVSLYDRAQLVFAEADSYHLLDASVTTTLQINLDIPKDISFTHLQFNIGIDSLTNSSGAFGGDLDPTNGMYWTWQSGYINFKLEGKAAQCPARQNRFQLHIGGYQGGHNTLQQVKMQVPSSGEIQIAIAIDELLSQMDLRKQYQIMSPGEEAVAVAELLPGLFSISEK